MNLVSTLRPHKSRVSLEQPRVFSSSSWTCVYVYWNDLGGKTEAPWETPSASFHCFFYLNRPLLRPCAFRHHFFSSFAFYSYHILSYLSPQFDQAFTCSPLCPPSELCLLAVSFFPSASSPSSSSSATRMARLHDRLRVTWLSSRLSQTTSRL